MSAEPGSGSTPQSNVGSHREWNAIWESDTDRVFTRGKPASLGQFWQQCYFADLWSEMGPTASSMRCIELGAGRGTTSMYLADRGCDVTLVDLAPKAFDLARNEFSRVNLKPPHCVFGDATSTGLPSQSFDCAYNIGVLEHFQDPVPLLRETCRLLRPGGLLFMVIVPLGTFRTALAARLLFAPWRPILGTSRRWLLKRLGLEKPTPPSTMIRTSYPDAAWEGWMRDLGQPDFRCIPYNPYPPVYANAWAERMITLPAYQLHLAIRSRLAQQPLLATSPFLGMCQLLVGRTRSNPN